MDEHEEHIEEDFDIDLDLDEITGGPHRKIVKKFKFPGGKQAKMHIAMDDDCSDSGKHHMIIKKGGPGLGKHKMHKMKKCMTVEILKDEGNRIMFLSLPGIDKSTLSVKAKKKAVLIESDYLADFQKIYGEKVSEKIRLPVPINPDKIEAEYKTGILKLTFFGVDALDPAVDIDVAATDD